jgi:hypothetical protein
MHPSTMPLNGFSENKQLADQHGIIMGSSHAEPMLRNNIREWTAPAADGVSLGGGEIRILNTGTEDGSPEWAQGVLNNAVPVSMDFTVPAAGHTTLRVHLIDPGIAFDTIIVEPRERSSEP